MIRLSANIDHRVDGIPQAAVNEDQAQRALIAHLTGQVLESPNHKESLQKNPEDGENYTPMTDLAKKIIEEQGNVEAFELWNSRTKSCAHLATGLMSSGHVHCHCGRIITCANPDPVIEE